MNVKEAFTSRRSVRRFLPKTVPIEKINNILECATFAPSGHNIQPWHVYVVQGKKKEAITNSILESIKNGSSKSFEQEVHTLNLQRNRINRGLSVSLMYFLF